MSMLNGETFPATLKAMTQIRGILRTLGVELGKYRLTFDSCGDETGSLHLYGYCPGNSSQVYWLLTHEDELHRCKLEEFEDEYLRLPEPHEAAAMLAQGMELGPIPVPEPDDGNIPF